MLLTAELAAHIRTAHLEVHAQPQPMPPHIRPATVHDLTELLVLERETPTAPHWSAADYKAMLEKAQNHAPDQLLRRHLIVAAEAGTLTGFAVARALGRAPDEVKAGMEAEVEAEIESVVVHPEARRQGLGTALCRALLHWAQTQGAAAMTLEVRARSTGAIHLYTGLGFVSTGRRPGYYHQPADDALLMRCALQQSTRKPAPPGGPTGWLDV